MANFNRRRALFCAVLIQLITFSSMSADKASTKRTAVLPPKLQSEGDWDQLIKVCETDFEEYENGLGKLRTNLKREIDKMPQDEFMSRYRKDDLMIRFVRIHWPILFSAKDTGWAIYQGCAERNLAARKFIGTTGISPRDREAKIQGLQDCLQSIFSPDLPIQPPFDRLLACYRTHVK